ncbi:hypothetical protein DL771_009915 [Monosporascus sp. 5C6A]|nr:hypothetical protein DL771_009915 [Monosporascus sp. 5C6A]
MGNPKNDHVGVPQPRETTDPSVLDAMMSDLGVGRLEDLATDDGGNHGRRQGLPPQSSDNKQTSVSQTRPGTSNALAEMYRNAIKEGVFHDDDYYAVKNLDTIEDGNLHRQKQASLHNGQSNSARSFSAQDRRPFQGAASGARRFPQYDPLRPSYRSLNAQRSRRTMESVAPGYDVSSLGGLHVPGMPVKRWEPGQKVLSTADLNPNGVTPAPSREQPVTMQPALPRAVPDRPTADFPPHLRPTRATTHLNRKASDIVSPQATNRAAETKQHTPQTRKVTEVYDTPKSNGLLPPHLRRTPNNSQSHGKAVPPSTNPTQVPASTNQTEQSGVSATPVEADEYLFQADVVLQYQVNGQVQKGFGQVSVYELAQQPIVIWELIAGERVTRKDIRRLLLPFVNGSLVIVRWQDKPGSDIQTSDIRFDNISAARDFEKVVRQQRKQGAQSTAPIFEQETEADVPSDVQPNVTPENLPNTGQTQTVHRSSGACASTGLAQPQEDKRAITPPREHHAAKETRSPELVVDTTSYEEEPKDLRGQASSIVPLPPFVRESTSDYLIDLSDSAEVKTIRRSYMDDLIGVDLTTSSVQKVGAGSPSGEVEAMNAAPVVEGPVGGIEASSLTISEDSSGSKATTQAQSGGVRPPASTSLETAFVNLKTTEANSLGEHISQDALRFLHHLPPSVYEEMRKMSHEIVPHLELAQCVPPAQAKITEYAPFQIAWVRLRRIEEYNRLGWDAKQTVLRMVYYNIVHGDNRIVRPPQDILRMRDSKQSCPDEVKELNELVRMGNHRELLKCDPYGRAHPAPLGPQPSPYSYEVITKKAMDQAKFLYDDQPQGDVKSPTPAADSAHTEKAPSAGVPTAQIRPPSVATVTKTDNQKTVSAPVETRPLISEPKKAPDSGVTTQQSRSVSGWDFIDEAEEDWGQKPQPPVVYKSQQHTEKTTAMKPVESLSFQQHLQRSLEGSMNATGVRKAGRMPLGDATNQSQLCTGSTRPRTAPLPPHLLRKASSALGQKPGPSQSTLNGAAEYHSTSSSPLVGDNRSRAHVALDTKATSSSEVSPFQPSLSSQKASGSRQLNTDTNPSTSRWASTPGQRASINRGLGLDGASSDMEEAQSQGTQLPRSPSHKRSGTDDTQSSEMTRLAKRVNSIPMGDCKPS